jgi:hypothetical protein
VDDDDGGGGGWARGGGGEFVRVFDRTLSLIVRERVLGLLVNVIVSVRSFNLAVCCRVLCTIIG